MPWKECNQMDERQKFIARLLDGEKMAAVCRDFNVSRKTGYKILKRYNDVGLDGLTDRSRRPYRHANQLPVQIEALIVRCKQDKPHWGAPKIRERLARLYPDVHTPATRCRRSSAAQARARRPRQPAEAATPSNYFLCRDPGAGFAPSYWVNAP
jgi:putative transposase